jgi:putative FmdB family regulatory protein
VPLYEYQCRACDHRFEVIQKFSDAPVKKCPKCGKSGKVERLVSSPAIQFKGTGWYITDYARKSAPSDTGAKTETKDGTDKSDSKDAPAEKTSPAPAAKDSPAKKSRKD